MAVLWRHFSCERLEWFWRNRDKQDVTVTLYARGDYNEMKQPK